MSDFIQKVGFIRKAHEGQIDKQGQDYYTTHLAPVALMVAPKLTLAALAHDILEDTPTTIEDLFNAGFNASDVKLIRLLTHDKNTTRGEYLQRICKDRDAIQIKIADVANNLSRLATVSDEQTQLRLYRKYTHTLYTLAGIT